MKVTPFIRFLMLWGLILSGTLAAIQSAYSFIILPPDCRDKNETGCLLKHKLDYIFIFDHITYDEYRFFKKLDGIWPENLPLPIIYLESPGGSSRAAMFVGRILHKRHAVVVSGNPITKTDGYDCDSACSIIAAGATERHMNEVGFHQIRFVANHCKPNQTVTAVQDDSHQKVYDYLEEVGADPRVKDYYRDTPYDQITELYFSSFVPTEFQNIVQTGFHMERSSSFQGDGFTKDKVRLTQRSQDSRYRFAILQRSNAAILDYVDYLTCEADGQKPDYRTAADVLQIGVYRDDPDSIYQLAQFIEDGKIDGKSITDAVKLYKRGASLKDGASEDRLGWLSYDGERVPQDYTTALNWFKEAADQGNTDTYGSLCKVYMEAKAVQANDVESYKWCDLAIAELDNGDLKDFAIDAIHKLTSRMTDSDIDKATKSEWFYRSIAEN